MPWSRSWRGNESVRRELDGWAVHLYRDQQTQGGKARGRQAGYIALVFFGVFNLLIGYLVFKSTFMPRILGALMALSGLGWLTFLSPPLANDLLTPIEVVGIVAEGALMLWLLVMGVNSQRWSERAVVARS
jgi:hypothetical protein